MACNNAATCEAVGITYTAGTKNVTSVQSVASGVISVYMNASSGNGTLTLTPSTFATPPVAVALDAAASAGSQIQWVCATGTINKKYVPANCR
jgi:hypothetical protein